MHEKGIVGTKRVRMTNRYGPRWLPFTIHIICTGTQTKTITGTTVEIGNSVNDGEDATALL